MATGLRIGLLGAGRIGSFHARTVAGLDTVAALTICDPVPGRAAEVAGPLGASAAKTVRDVIAARPDAVVVAAATRTHADLVRATVSAGIPTFCEKPLAAGLAETRELVGLIEDSGVPVSVGLQRRHDPAHRALRARLHGGELGEPYLIRMVVGDDAPPPAGYLPGSGGLFRDQSVHDFDVLRWLTGQEVTEVYASGANLTGSPGFAEADDIDTGAALLRLSGGPVATLTASRHSASGYDVRLELAGSRGVASVGAGDATGGFLVRFADAYRAELRGFLDFAVGRGENPCPARDALAALLVAEAADRSRREHRPVVPEPV